MKLTRRETEILDYVRKEARVYERCTQAEYMSLDARRKYQGMSHALNRLAGEILEGEHRKYAQGEPNATERGLGHTSTDTLPDHLTDNRPERFTVEYIGGFGGEWQIKDQAGNEVAILNFKPTGWYIMYVGPRAGQQTGPFKRHEDAVAYLQGEPV